MISRAVGYSGFQSYGDLPFSNLKPGKEHQKDDKIWESTSRQQDTKPHLQNYHHLKSTYRKDYLENTMPEHYNVDIVKKGSTGFQKFSANNTVKNYEKLESSGFNNSKNVGDSLNLLKTGVQHWKSNYRKTNNDLNKHRDGLSKSVTNGFRSNIYNADLQGLDYQNSLIPNQKNSSLISNGNLPIDGNSVVGEKFGVNQRSASASKPGSSNAFRPNAPAWSKNSKAYSNKTPTGVTQYKFIYGQKIGHEPKPHILDQYSTKQPRLFNPLKAGTTQHVQHIPGYQGFLPASKTFGQAFEHGKGENTRTTFLKSNLIENYHVQIPGYSGFQTKQNFISNDKLRSSCFRSNEFVKN